MGTEILELFKSILKESFILMGISVNIKTDRSRNIRWVLDNNIFPLSASKSFITSKASKPREENQ